AVRYCTEVEALAGKVAPVEPSHRHLQHLLYRFLCGSRTETPQGSQLACAPGDVAPRIAESGKRDYSRPLLSEPDVKVSLHPAQAWNNAPGRTCGAPFAGHGFETVRPLACTCLWQFGWIRTRFSTPSVPPSVV